MVDFNGDLRSASVIPDGLRFTYESSARALALLNARPRKLEIDGAPSDPKLQRVRHRFRPYATARKACCATHFVVASCSAQLSALAHVRQARRGQLSRAPHQFHGARHRDRDSVLRPRRESPLAHQAVASLPQTGFGSLRYLKVDRKLRVVDFET